MDDRRRLDGRGRRGGGDVREDVWIAQDMSKQIISERKKDGLGRLVECSGTNFTVHMENVLGYLDEAQCLMLAQMVQTAQRVFEVKAQVMC